MTTETPPATDAGNGSAVVPTIIHGDVIAVYESMLDQVPDAGTEGVEAILEQIATATSSSELDDPWKAGGLGAYVDMPIVVTGIRKMPSDYEGGLAYFLIVDGAVRATGEKLAATTGSIGVVAQLVKAHNLGAFPLVAIPRLAKRTTKEGYRPMHLEVVEA